MWGPSAVPFSQVSRIWVFSILKFRRPQRYVAHETLEPRTLLAAEVLISEIAADNHGELTTRIRTSREATFEGDPIAPDWLEIYNASGQSLSLDGMHLTDDPTDLRKWAFPGEARVDSGEFLVVFASGSNLRSAELDERGYFHTNFRLSSDGEFLALTDREGNITHQYAPRFPANSGATFGVPMRRETLVAAQNTLHTPHVVAATPSGFGSPLLRSRRPR